MHTHTHTHTHTLLDAQNMSQRGRKTGEVGGGTEEEKCLIVLSVSFTLSQI